MELTQVLPPLMRIMLDPAGYDFNLLALPHFALALVIAAIGAAVWHWEGNNRVGRLFVAFTSLFALWVSGRGVIRLLNDPELIILLSRNLYLICALAMPILLQVVAMILQREPQFRRLIAINWVVAGFFSLASVNTAMVIDGIHRFSWGAEPRLGGLGYLYILWVSILVVIVTRVLLAACLRSQPGSEERARLVWFAVAMLFLYVASIEFLSGLGLAVYPAGGVAVLVFSVMVAWITRRYGMIEITAQLAAGEIASMVRGALLIVDARGDIKFLSAQAMDLLGPQASHWVGRPAQEVLGEALSVRQLAQMAAREGSGEEKELPYTGSAEAKPRNLTLSVAGVADKQGRRSAYVCVLRDLTEQRREEQERSRERVTDSLTGLPNRAMFLGLLDAAAERRRLEGRYGYAVIFIGIDRMRVVNDDLGYSAGDALLREMAQRLRRATRPQDAIARVGGDEFGVLIRGMSQEDELAAYIGQLRSILLAPLAVGGQELFPAASIGVTTSEGGQASGDELLHAAGTAMYAAKESGGGGTRFFANNREQKPQRLRQESELRRAVEQAEFQPYFQPVVDIYERRLAGFEALVRWQHPQRGMLLPSEFIDLATELGLITDIDFQMLRQVCERLPEFQRLSAGSSVFVSVNLEETCLRTPAIVEQVGEMLVRHHIPPACLRVEVLERIVQLGPVASTLQGLRDLGIGLYVDDFGTGYSALSRLHTLPITAVKIDREFVRSMSQGAGGEKVIGGILALSRSLGLDVIAEGVSTAEEAARLRDAGCRYLQGFFFSPGVSSAAAADLLGERQPFASQFNEVERFRRGATVRAGGAPHLSLIQPSGPGS